MASLASYVAQRSLHTHYRVRCQWVSLSRAWYKIRKRAVWEQRGFEDNVTGLNTSKAALLVIGVSPILLR
jgi:hypothetical protein